MTHAAYLAALRRLYRPTRAVDLPQTLDPMHRLLAALDDPQRQYPAVVVAGSTGKGTTAHRLAAGLRQVGLRVGLYTSPHLHLFRERFVVDDRLIAHDEFVASAERVEAAARRVGDPFSTFENATALALDWFAAREVDIAVLEVGIGGRFDAVNAVDNVLALFTPVEGEHRAMLGGTLESIAWHKAGVMRPGRLALTVPQRPVVMHVLEREADALGAGLFIAQNDRILPTDALRLLAEMDLTPPGPLPVQVRANLPGRLELVQLGDKTVLIDGGHTPLAAQRLRRSIDLLLEWRMTARVVVGLLDDKDAAAYLSAFDARDYHVMLTPLPGHRAAARDALARAFQPQHASVSLARDVETAFAALADAPETVIVVAGSLRLAALAREAFGLLDADDLAEAAATRAILSPATAV